MMRFAINGFGRVGRTLLRVYRTREDAQARFELAAINEIAMQTRSRISLDTILIMAVTPVVLPCQGHCWQLTICWCR